MIGGGVAWQLPLWQFGFLGTKTPCKTCCTFLCRVHPLKTNLSCQHGTPHQCILGSVSVALCHNVWHGRQGWISKCGYNLAELLREKVDGNVTWLVPW